MSDIELVREVYTAMAARDVGRRFELIDPTFVVTQDPALPWGGRHVGHNVAFDIPVAAHFPIDTAAMLEALAQTP